MDGVHQNPSDQNRDDISLPVTWIEIPFGMNPFSEQTSSEHLLSVRHQGTKAELVLRSLRLREETNKRSRVNRKL